MKLHALALAAGVVMAGNAHAINKLNLTDEFDLGDFGAPEIYGDTFSVSTKGTIDHSLTFDILTDLYAGAGLIDLELGVSVGKFTLTFTNITGLSAKIYDNNGGLYASFVAPTTDPDFLVLPWGSFFEMGNYTLKIGGEATGSLGGSYVIAAATAPVPEPETWGMLLAGLGLIGLRLRQKRGGAIA